MSTTVDQVISSSRFGKNHSKPISDQICEAYRCNKQATVQKIVNVGIFGDVTLNLCRNCVSKFNDHVVMTKNSSEDYSLPMDRKKGFFNNEYISTA
jgi:hypothetical protein